MKIQDNDINRIMDNFDFLAVHKLMTMFDWKWISSQTDTKVPSVSEIKEKAKYLLEEIQDEDTISIASGGLEVRRIKNSTEPDILELKFVFRSSSSYISVQQTESVI